MGRKNYCEDDEIEIKLVHNVSTYYDLAWRFKEPRKFLFFKLRDKWKYINKYYPNEYNDGEGNPNDDFYWHCISFNLGKKSDAQLYESMKAKTHTKKQLFDYYHVKENMESYHQDMEKHEKWLKETNEAIKRLTR